MQHRPKFNGVYIAVLLALALLAFNLWTTFSTASSGVSMPYSKVVDYFEANQVVGFEMDLNTGNLRLALKEGEVPLPEGVKEAAAEQQHHVRPGRAEGVLQGGGVQLGHIPPGQKLRQGVEVPGILCKAGHWFSSSR